MRLDYNLQKEQNKIESERQISIGNKYSKMQDKNLLQNKNPF